MNGAMTAIIRKDFRAVTTNKHLLTGLLAVPIALTIVMPSIFLFMIHFAPEETDIQKMLEILPPAMRSENPELTAAGMVLNFVLPVFFLIIPVMAASIMAGQLLCRRKGETYSGDAALLSSVCKRDLQSQSHRIFSSEYDGIGDIFLGDDIGASGRGFFSDRQFFSSERQLADNTSFSVSGRLADSCNVDSARFGQGPQHGRISAERSISDNSDHTPHGRTVCGIADYKRLDNNRAWSSMRPDRLAPS